MTKPDADHNLLFGILGLQVGLIEQPDLVAAFQTWSKCKATPLAEVLVARGAMTGEDRTVLESLVRRHVEKHGGDTEKSLAAVGPTRTVRDELARVADPDLQETLARLSVTSATEPDPGATATWGLGAPTSDGARFRLLRPHAKGGIGVVSVALDAELHREVALKEIRPEQADDVVSRARFLLEAELTGRLEHPGVVPVYGLGADARGRPFYAMRLVKGDSLKEAIDRFHKGDEGAGRDPGARELALRKLLARFVAVCDAVAYAHGRGVIHRDIKPANILLGPYGETLVVDWGLAKVVGREETPVGAEETLKPATASGSSETQAGTAIGTPAYMSPEQAEGRLEAMGPASDVYSLGATLFCLLTGRPPLVDAEVVEILRKVRQGEIPAAREVNPRVPAPLEGVCKKAMALAPTDRYPSPRALADEVEHWLADEPVSAYRDPWWVRARRDLKRHKSLVGALVIAVPVALVSLGSIAAHEGLTNRRLESNNEELAQANVAARASLLRATAREDLSFRALDNYRRVVQENPDLLNRPDLLPLRKKLLEAPLEFYTQLKKEVDEAPADLPPALRDEARRRVALAEAGLATVNAEIGSETEAMKAYQQAIDTLSPMIDARSPSHERSQLASVLNNFGNLLIDLGRLDAARATHERALALRERLAREKPKGDGPRSDLALSHSNLGWVDGLSGRAESSLAHYFKCREIRERFVRDAPRDVYRRAALAQACTNLGWMLGRVRRTGEARESLRRSIDLLKGLIAENPGDLSARIDLGSAYDNLAVIETGDAGLGFLQSALALREAVAREFPSVAKYRSALAESLASLGARHREAGRFDDARLAQERAVSVMEAAVREHPDSAHHQTDFASCLNHLGMTLLEQGRPSDALPVYDRVVDLLAALQPRDPTNAELESLLAGVFNNRGLALAAVGRHEDAVADYHKAIDHERACYDRSPENFQYRDWLSRHYDNLGKSLRALGRSAESLDVEGVRMRLWPRDLGAAYDPGASYYNHACWLTLAAAGLGGGRPDAELTEAERTQRRSLIDRAVAALGVALDDGFRDLGILLRDADFATIRSRPDFDAQVTLAMDLVMPADPFAPPRAAAGSLPGP